MLKIYNSLSRKLEEFSPIEPGKVKMYCCGPTVYDLLHVGNFRGPVFYNFVREWLEHLGYKVIYVYNYTDVDDKIINRALKDGVSAESVAQKYIAEFEADFARLGLRKHDLNPKVTETMPEILQMVQELLGAQKAYVIGGDVLYSIRSFLGYGKLSGRNPDELLSGVRIEKDATKKDPLDFALWKSAKAGEPAWTSPWGAGRPGWHIECSAMIRKHLGEQIDIHGGGMDLIFPHHENEIAQSEGCSGKIFVKYWIHNNMLNLGGAKMSKSLGNIRTGRSFMDEYHPEIFKYMMMSVHYRSVSDFSEEVIETNIRSLARIYSCLALAESFILEGDQTTDDKFEKLTQEAWWQIEKSLNDDFGTPEAFARIFEVVRQFNQIAKRGMRTSPALSAKARAVKNLIVRFGGMMALFQMPALKFLTELDDILLRKMKLERANVDHLVAKRAFARAEKDFAKSDELRAELTKMGISVSDLPEGSFWEVTK